MSFGQFTICAAVALLYAVPSEATDLIAGSGWQVDTIDKPGEASMKSVWSFSISGPATLAVTDSFIPGDIFTLNGDVIGTTSFYAGSSTDIQATGSFGPRWTDGNYSKIAVPLEQGSYSFTITGNGAGGTPSGLGVRLDLGSVDVSSVPEASTWVMMTTGFGIMGMTIRRRRRCAPITC